MNVLISIQQPVRAWQIPDASVATLRTRFPHLNFIHATDDQARTRALRECDVAFTWILTAYELEQAPRLRWIHSSAVAVETFCLPEIFARRIVVSNSRGIQSAPIAEHVLAVTLALAKQLPAVIDSQRARHWAQNELIGDRLPWLLKGRTLGLIGVGTIGSEIARLARAFGMQVIAVRRRSVQGGVLEIDEILPTGELGVTARPQRRRRHRRAVDGGYPEHDRRRRARTHEARLAADQRRARQDPQSRRAGRSAPVGAPRGASLDVFVKEPLPADDPLWTLPNVILTPHTSGFRQGHWEDVIDLFSENLRRFEAGQPVRFQVQQELGY